MRDDAGSGLSGAANLRGEVMRDVKEMFRIVGIILLGLFVLVVGVPLVLGAAGIVVGTIIGLAVLLIKVAVTLAVVYLVLAGVRALLK
jgi:hypothetical protein